MTADQTREQHPTFFNLSMEDKMNIAKFNPALTLDASIEKQVADIKACLDAMEGHAKAGNSEGVLFFAERIAETARYIESMVPSWSQIKVDEEA